MQANRYGMNITRPTTRSKRRRSHGEGIFQWWDTSPQSWERQKQDNKIKMYEENEKSTAKKWQLKIGSKSDFSTTGAKQLKSFGLV